MFPIVSIGASAGGFEAISIFIKNISSNPGMSYVVIQHLDPNHHSRLSELLNKYTELPIIEVRQKIKIKINSIYIIPPNKIMTIKDKTLILSPLDKGNHPSSSHNIDIFFRSAAADLKELSIGILMSGSGNDGTLGAKAIKAEMGIVIAQDPNTARYTGMPQAAIDMGLADIIAEPEKMNHILDDYIKTSYGNKDKRLKEIDENSKSLIQIFSLIREKLNIDFSNYKQSTVKRRLNRRMGVNRIYKLSDYLRILKENKEEIDALINDFLINITSFFRDKEAFDVLKLHIIKYLENSFKDKVLRVWIPGCSTGEEAYSIAILIDESLSEIPHDMDFQIFATDLDLDAINSARKGTYPLSIFADISQKRIGKYFIQKRKYYQIKNHIREKMIFSQQDFINDPPFSRVDIISTRNLFIYFSSELQKKKLIPMLHYSLNEAGLLFLGTAESAEDNNDFFEVLDRKWKIYRRKTNNKKIYTFNNENFHWGRSKAEKINNTDIQSLNGVFPYKSDQLLLSALEPSVILNSEFEIIYIHGDTACFLSLPTGRPNMNILKMVNPELQLALSGGLNSAAKKLKKVLLDNLLVKSNGKNINFRVIINPIKDNSEKNEFLHYVITFSQIFNAENLETDKSKLSVYNKDLEDELKYTKESLRNTIEEMETANEELRSANEEFQSTNEELQSTNEELETSREELQSLNEELVTVNAEHQKKIEELYIINDDMNNLLNSTGIATIFLDNQMNLSRFTPKATEFFNFIDSDIGRPLKHITSQIEYAELVAKTKNVLNTLQPEEKNIRKNDGTWYSMRIYPYRTTENKIAGAVISFINISSNWQFARAIVDTIKYPILLLDDEFYVVLANKAYFDFFQTSCDLVENVVFFSLENEMWNITELKKLLVKILERNDSFQGFQVKHQFPGVNEKSLILNATCMAAFNNNRSGIYITFCENKNS